jgi:uncharacterized Zn finger protein
MVIKLSRHAIRQWCSPQTYQKGERLSNGGKVNVLRYDEDEGIYIAEVLGHERNQVQVYEDAQGAPVARCTCPSLSTGGMYCHHVVAVLIRISDLKHSAQAGSVRTDAARQMTGSAMSASDEDGGEIAERIIRLFEENTLEEKMMQLLEQKKLLIDDIARPGADSASLLSEQELREILMI